MLGQISTCRTVSWLGATLLLVLLGSAEAAAKAKRMDPVDYVSPNIGGIGQLLTATIPYVQTPHGMARLAPVTTPEIKDRYLADKIYGFPAGPAMLMISSVKVSTRPKDHASTFDHDFEAAWALYYAFVLSADSTAHLVLSMEGGSELRVVGNSAVEGSERVGGSVAQLSENDGETREYFYAEFSKPFRHYQTWQNDAFSQNVKQTRD